MWKDKWIVRLGNITGVTAILLACAVTDTVSAANNNENWSLFDPFTLDVVAVNQAESVETFSVSSVQASQPLTTVSSLPSRGISAASVTSPSEEQNGSTLRTPPVRIPIKPDLRTPYRPWSSYY